MRGDINFKGSDSSDLSVYFLFCGKSTNQPRWRLMTRKTSCAKEEIGSDCDIHSDHRSGSHVKGYFYQQRGVFKNEIPATRGFENP